MRPDITIVIPFLNEEAVLPALRDRFEKLSELPANREFLFISDGSTDNGPRFIHEWAAKDPRIKLIEFTRNFGHQAAISAGLDRAQGRYVGILDADLQDPPESLLEMFQIATTGRFDVVYGVRAQRSGNFFKLFLYRLFYNLYSRLAETPVDPDSGDFCVLSRRAVGILGKMPEKVRFVRGLRSWMGLKSKAVAISRPQRELGTSQYSWAKLFNLALNGITSFSAKPLRVATVSGLLLCGISTALAAYYLVLGVFCDIHMRAPGFTTIVILILFLSGCQLLMIGIIGEYIAQIFWEVKGRPAYLIERTVNLDTDEEAAS
jgi:dolichol-phosphate mannosyltransferase